MQIEEKLTFEQYWNDKRFQSKKPDIYSIRGKNGDNIYEPLLNGRWKQHPSFHTKPKFTAHEDEKNKGKDLSGGWVLVSQKFIYFGRKARPIPPELATYLSVCRGHKCKFPSDVIERWNTFIEDILTKQRGIVANPCEFPEINENNLEQKGC